MSSIGRYFRITRSVLFYTALGIVHFTPAIPSALGSEPALVNVNSVDPTILVELRYATSHNFTKRALYPPGMVALVRPSVAHRLAIAQSFLRERGYGLKIWDAYRPKAAHQQLWQISQNKSFVANPEDRIGSLHTWGVAIDATLVDAKGYDLAMPTDFDVFTLGASMHYRGTDMDVRAHLRILQRAMGRAGFLGMGMEWWHFVAPDWKRYGPVPESNLSLQTHASTRILQGG